MKWRRKDWKNPNRLIFVGSQLAGPENATAFRAYEDGADAMLTDVIAYLQGLDPQTNIQSVIKELERK